MLLNISVGLGKVREGGDIPEVSRALRQGTRLWLSPFQKLLGTFLLYAELLEHVWWRIILKMCV